MNKLQKLDQGSTESHPTVITAKESAAILKRCEEKIDLAYGQLRRGEQLNEGLRFVIGAQMATAKPHVPHGNGGGDGFSAWLNHHWPAVEERTAQRWMLFASTVLQVGVKSKNDTVSFFKELPERISQGEFDFSKDLREVTDAVSELMGDLGMMDFIDANTERRRGGAMEIKFSCPVCSEKLKGLAGRNVKCTGCGNTCKAKPDVKDTTDADRAAASQALLDLAGQLHHEVDTATGDAPQTSHRALASDEAWQALRDACLRVTTLKLSRTAAATKPDRKKTTKRKK